MFNFVQDVLRTMSFSRKNEAQENQKPVPVIASFALPHQRISAGNNEEKKRDKNASPKQQQNKRPAHDPERRQRTLPVLLDTRRTALIEHATIDILT